MSFQTINMEAPNRGSTMEDKSDHLFYSDVQKKISHQKQQLGDCWIYFGYNFICESTLIWGENYPKESYHHPLWIITTTM